MAQDPQREPDTNDTPVLEAPRFQIVQPADAIGKLAAREDDGATQGNPGGGPWSEPELDLACGDGAWLVSWVEDENGDPVEGSHEAECLSDEEM